MYRDDPVRLQHMLDAAQEAAGFAQGQARAALDTDRKLVPRTGFLRVRVSSYPTFPGMTSSVCAIAWFMPTSMST